MRLLISSLMNKVNDFRFFHIGGIISYLTSMFHICEAHEVLQYVKKFSSIFYSTVLTGI